MSMSDSIYPVSREEKKEQQVEKKKKEVLIEF